MQVGIFSKYGKRIRISADEPTLFKDTIIEGDKPFLQKVDLYKFQSDQLAIKLLAEESTEIEAVEVIKYNFTEYTVLKDFKKQKVTDNNFVRFLPPESKDITFKLKGLKEVEITFGLVELLTKDTNYLPMAFQFKDGYMMTKLSKKKDSIKIKNPYKEKEPKEKHLAFVFSINKYKYYEYEAQVYSNVEEIKAEEDNNLAVKVSLSVVGVFILLVIIGIIVFYFVKKNKSKKTDDLDEYVKQEDNNNIESINDEENNIDTQIKNNNVVTNSNYNSISSDNNKNKAKYIRRFDDDEEDDDKRLFKSFGED